VIGPDRAEAATRGAGAVAPDQRSLGGGDQDELIEIVFAESHRRWRCRLSKAKVRPRQYRRGQLRPVIAWSGGGSFAVAGKAKRRRAPETRRSAIIRGR
jgi:hypothetical protein